jgi:TonB family protein
MANYANDIKRYLGGEMSPAERHALEKSALSDPFLADALEGAQEIPTADFEKDSKSILQQLMEEVNQRPLVQKQSFFGSTVFRMAAGLVLLAIASFLIWRVANTDQTVAPVALNETALATDTVNEQITKQSESERSEQLALAEERPKQKDVISNKKQAVGTSAAPTPTDDQKKPGEGDVAAAGKMTENASPPSIVMAKEKAVAEVLPQEAPATVIMPENDEQEKLYDTKKEDKAEVTKRASANPSVPLRLDQGNQITGKVVSAEDGTPVPGVNVIIKGTNTGTVTDLNGNYQIQSLVPNATLVYSFIGMQSQEINTRGRKAVDVQMNTDVAALSEVVVVGYGAAQGDDSSTPILELAHPEMGNKAFKNYLENNVRYPETALSKKIEGRVTIEFFVEPDGSLSEFKVVRGIGSGCDEELIRLIKEGPAWVPSKRGTVAIRDKARVRLKFQLPTR